jgi:hypothetical protein
LRVRRTEQLIAIALPFLWLGLVLGISVIETPLKFKAPGITTALGLGIGRLVFHALNIVELAIACVLVIVVVRQAPDWPLVLLGAVITILLVQAFWLRPLLDDRAVRIIAGEDVPPSALHVAYIALEGVKLVALPVLGVALARRWLA